MLRLALVIAAILSSGVAHPLVPGSEPSMEEGATQQVASLSEDDVCRMMANLDVGKYDAGFRAFTEELESGGEPQDMNVRSPRPDQHVS